MLSLFPSFPVYTRPLIHFLVYKITDIIPRNPPKVKFPALSEEFSARGILPVNSNRKITQHKDTKDDSIPAECLEIMFLDITHQELDCDNGYKKCNNNACHQCQNLCRCKYETKFYKFQKACAKHDRNRQEKGKLCCYCS